MGANGVATLDFGDESDFASVTITGQSGIVSGSACEAWFMAATTADNGPDEHEMIAQEIIPVCGAIVASTGFTIVAQASSRWSGQFSVNWVWV